MPEAGREPERSLPGARPVALTLVAVLLGVWLWTLDTPFCRVPGFADWISNRNGLIAENYLRYGLADTGGAQVMNLEPVTDRADRVLYRGHPATLDLLTAGVFRITGSMAPWAHRLLPLIGSLLAIVLLQRLLVGRRADPWPAIALLALLPVFVINGTNLSYEQLCLPWMLAAVLLHGRGWRWRLLPWLFAGGLIDFPVLYLAPVFAAVELRAGATRRALAFGAALALTAVATVGAHVLHVVLTMGDLQGNQGMPWHEKILGVLFEARLMPTAGEYLSFVGAALADGYTIAALALALVGSALVRRRLGLPALAFLAAGLLHLVVFRGHAAKHHWWNWYLIPFVAIAGGAALVRLPRAVAWGTLALVAAFGGLRSFTVWQERSAPPVRAVAADLARLFDSETVLHQLRAPPGWALETFRESPVMEGMDFFAQVFATGTFRPYLDNVATWGYLHRPQVAFLFLEAAEGGDLAQVERVLPGVRLGERSGDAGRYALFDLGRYLFDPAASPFLRERFGDAECARLQDRARLHLVVPLVPAGTRLLWLDGTSGVAERLRGRTVRSAGDQELARPPAGSTFAAWPESAWAKRLEARAGAGLERLPLRWRDRSLGVPVWRP